jgi:hypothetical protein
MIGIYKLVFEGLEDWPYVGQSRNIEARFKAHKYSFEQGHYNPKLNEAYEMCGLPNLEIIEECRIIDLNSREAYWIDRLNSINQGLNIAEVDIFRGGTEHPRAKYSKEQIIQALPLLQDPELSLKDIEKITGISEGQLYNIKAGRTHTWIQEEFPEEFLKILQTSRRKQGHSHQRAKFTEEQILKVLELLQDPKLLVREIEESTGVAEDTIRSILAGRSHHYLREEHPKAFLVIDRIDRKRHKFIESIYLYKDGKKTEVLDVKQFCQSHNLEQTRVKQLLNGYLKIYEGWYLQPAKQIATIKSPDNKLYRIYERGVSAFAATHSLLKQSLSLVIKGDQKSTKGWSLATKSEILSLAYGDEKN